MRHQVFRFGLTQAFAHSALNTHQTSTEMVFGQFAHRTHPAIPQVIDIINFAAPIPEIDQNLDDFQDVARRQGQLLERLDVGAQGLDPCDKRLGLFFGEILGNGARTEG
ncbi:MAG: hypothetical protein BWY57_02857 [Betaproteobacteria bacterium ADurb.Bin341]|nr:MAG: hypothetical protein BWY57_02857 [Betaproteobacteria bacterium ADurb.Bin341]